MARARLVRPAKSSSFYAVARPLLCRLQMAKWRPTLIARTRLGRITTARRSDCFRKRAEGGSSDETTDSIRTAACTERSRPTSAFIRLQALDTATKHTVNPSDRSELFAIHASSLCKQVSSGKGETIALLDSVDFTASWKAMTGIAGPSGGGKSILLYCLAGLKPVSSGQVEVLGRRISAMGLAVSARFRRAHLGFVFRSYDLVSSMSVEDNLKLPFMLCKIRWPEDRALKLLVRLGIRSERQRAALARALISDPDHSRR